MSGNGFSHELEVAASRYREDIRAAIQGRTGDATLAEDVAQETLVRVFDRLRGDGLQEPSKLENFMHRVAANVLREARRKDRRQDTDTQVVDQAISTSETPFESRSRSEASRLVWIALDGMRNEEYRQVLVRSYLEQESRESICAELGLTPRELTQLLFRAKRSLKHELGKAERRHGLGLVN